MNIELSGEENALLISALTCKIEKLKAQAMLHRQEGMSHWAVDCLKEVDSCVALKDRLFK